MNDVSIASNRVKRLSALAQLVRALAKQGITRTSDLVAETGYSARAIQFAKAELEANPASPKANPASHQSEARFASENTVPPLKERSPPAPPLKKIHPTPIADEESPLCKTHDPPAEGITSHPSETKASTSLLTFPDPIGRARLVAGKIELDQIERADWEPQLGGVTQLNLALLEIAPFVQPNGNRPLLVQIRSQLARKVRDKLDRDSRYAAAVAHNKPAQKPFRPTRFG